MSDADWLAKRFEASRGHLRAVAYRMLGSLGEAEDAVQESWLRVSRADTSGLENLEGWFTTVVARVCLNVLRSRRSRREESLEAEGTKPRASLAKGMDPEDEAVLAESVGLALLVVLERLTPAERVAFVLHDVFDLAFEDIAAIVGRSPAAARQLASRARRRVRGTSRGSGAALSEQRQTVEAFLAALRAGDMNGLLAVLDPDIVRRADSVAVTLEEARELHGARAVAEEALKYRDIARFARPIQVNGSAGIVVAPEGQLRTVISCTVEGGKIKKMEVIADPEHLRKLNLTVFPD
ncbi:MAG TPA: sigma-70 family RNA polymerase sigma factor [Terriglobales bacterium]|nr:sigma-70 family RNA polymerase sigma factor [Terriglobales bacterium]